MSAFMIELANSSPSSSKSSEILICNVSQSLKISRLVFLSRQT